MQQWYKETFGHEERNYETTKGILNKAYDGDTLMGMKVGKWLCKPLGELREIAKKTQKGGIAEGPTVDFEHIVGEAGALHAEYPGAMFQVASQYNYLEFPSKSTIPEKGITGYIFDHTQGPACALACPSATAFRNYILPTNGKSGQQSDNQQNALDLLDDKINELTGRSCFTIINGYLDSTEEDLQYFSDFIMTASPATRRMLKDTVKVGFHFNAEVHSHKKYVGQSFCAAPAISYSSVSSECPCWEPLSRLILEACYESCLWGSLLQRESTLHISRGKQLVFLTCIGGGVFANKPTWIADSISVAMQELHNYNAPLSIRLVHYRAADRFQYLV